MPPDGKSFKINDHGSTKTRINTPLSEKETAKVVLQNKSVSTLVTIAAIVIPVIAITIILIEGLQQPCYACGLAG